jgi:hypothetical protein
MRRAFFNAEGSACEAWQRKHLRKTYEPLLSEPSILASDRQVKPLSGSQEGARVGYNRKKPGRPAPVYHTYFIANRRLVRDSDVQAGNPPSAQPTQPKLWQRIDAWPPAGGPAFRRGDCVFGNESMLLNCEQRQLGSLFKLRLTNKVKALVKLVASRQAWSNAGQGWQGVGKPARAVGLEPHPPGDRAPASPGEAPKTGS